MSRPRLTSHQQRSERINVRFSIAEKDWIERQAVNAGLSPTDFVRSVALSVPVQNRNDREQLRRLTAELNSLGVNLNQITRHLNSGTATALDQRELVDVITLIREVIDEVF